MIENENKDKVKDETVASSGETVNETAAEDTTSVDVEESEESEGLVETDDAAETRESEESEESEMVEEQELEEPAMVEDERDQEEEESTADAEEEMEEEEGNVDAFDILNIFSEEASSSELGAGVHERVRLISVDPERRKDNNGNLVKKQLFLKFKKFTKEGVDVGEKEISFFLIDSAKDSAVNNLYTFIAQTRELLSVFLSEEEITEGFDPLSVLYDGDNDDREEDVVAEDFTYDLIKKRVLKKEKSYTDVETAICQQFTGLLKDKIGFDSKSFRLKLEESSDAKYIQIPRFDRFVEPAGVPKEESVLYANAK